MNINHSCLALLFLACGSALSTTGTAATPATTATPATAATPTHAAAHPWQSLLQDGAPAWRGWNTPGFPTGWHVAGVVQPFDHWNKTRILVRGMHVEHWLNGRKVVEYELQSADWKGKVAASKFAQYPNYGLGMTGMIGIQGDHPGALSIRRMRIRELT